MPFYGTSSDLTQTQNPHYVQLTHKLKQSTLHQINSLKISLACNSQDNFYVDNVCSGSASQTHYWLAVRVKKLAQDKPVYSSSHEHKQIRIKKDVLQHKNE